jgi:putative membrane protein
MYGFGWWPMGGMMAGWLLLTVLVTASVVCLVAAYARPDAGAHHAGTARRILAERFARGEFDTDEYRQRLDALT